MCHLEEFILDHAHKFALQTITDTSQTEVAVKAAQEIEAIFDWCWERLAVLSNALLEQAIQYHPYLNLHLVDICCDGTKGRHNMPLGIEWRHCLADLDRVIVHVEDLEDM